MHNYKISVDGSFVDEDNITGAVVVQDCSTKQLTTFRILCQKSKFSSSRNIYGEVAAAIYALQYIKSLMNAEPDIQVVIIHDYEGIKKWATGEWQSKKPISASYKKVVDSMPEVMKRVTFVHQKSHVGVTSENSYLNHLADRIAAGEITPGSVLSASL